METVQTAPATTNARLRESFLEPYRKKGDPFTSLLARSTYLTKYCRGNVETWTDTIRRVVEGNAAMTLKGISESEKEKLFHIFWTAQALPPGRGLWTGGVPGIPADAAFNCWYVTLREIDDWCWVANQLMLGGGVGVGVTEIASLPVPRDVKSRFAIWCSDGHPDLAEVRPEGPSFLNGTTPVFVVPDSREGWVEALRRTMIAAFEGKDLVVDVSGVRRRGLPIKTFGGIACGPGPLTNLLRAVWNLIRGSAGRPMSSVECLDVTNHIGLCIKSGNVRRSALIVLGEAGDRAFRDAKKDEGAILSHRHTSNNSLVFRTNEEIANFDWAGLVEDNIQFGEPGILNLAKIRETDPGAMGVNPCGEIPLHDREACNLAEVFPAKFESGMSAQTVFQLVTRYCLRNRLSTLTDAKADAIQRKNMRLGVGLGGICDFNWTPSLLAEWYGHVRSEADRYADELGVNRPIAVTTTKPSGTTSLLNASSPGIHAPHAPFYIRRTRIPTNDPMAQAMKDAGVPHEFDVYDKTGHTLVFEFPTKAMNARATKETETIEEQFERQAQVQDWWSDNSVSATLNFDPNTERERLASCLEKYVPRFKSTSCLATSHGYAMAPYETIDESEYNRRMVGINHDHPLVNGGEIEIDDCSSGACPVR